MKTLFIAAVAALGLSGCSLMIDPDSVEPPKDKKAPALGACIDAGTAGHKLCGGRASAGALSVTAAPSGGHQIKHGTADAGGAATISGTNHKIVQGIVSP